MTEKKGHFQHICLTILKPASGALFLAVGAEAKEADPLNYVISLDVPIESTDDLTLADMIIDDEAEACYRNIEDVDFWESVNRFLYEAIDHIKNEKGREIIRYMYENGGTKRKQLTSYIREVGHYMRTISKESGN